MFFNDWLSRRQIYTPERVAVTCPEGRSYTYREFNHRACALAVWMRGELGIEPGDRVACLSMNRIEYLDLFFSCGKVGAVLVPLNYRLPEPALRELIADCQPCLLVCEEEWREMAGALKAERKVAHVAAFGAGGVASICEHPTGIDFQAHAAGIEEIAMILYTSGTTGRAKGAMISWRQIHWNAVNTIIGLQLTQDDVTFLNTPLYHTGGWHVLFTPLMQLGGRVVLQTQFDPELCNQLIARERITILFGIPTTLRMMVESTSFAQADFSTLRTAICGGESCPMPVLRAYQEKGIPVRQGYGLTEAGPNCFSLPACEAMRKEGSVGFPNFHVATRIEKSNGSEAGSGEIGELLMSGPHLFSGYWKNPEATREALVDGWVRTGDLFKRDPEGFHYVVGRKKEMFISGGENVYPAQIERVIQQHPAVAQCAVIGVPDEKWGEVGRAFVVFRSGEATTPEELRRWCRQRLAGYQCPKLFTPVETLPVGHSGKSDKLALRSAAVDGSVPGNAAAQSSGNRMESSASAGEASVSAETPPLRACEIFLSRLRVHYLERSAEPEAQAVVFLHGNASSSVYWEEVMTDLPTGFRAIAPDLRGYGLTSREAVIDATRGVRDWVEDAFVLLELLAVRRFHLVGHSLGGMVCWGLLADPRFAGRIASLTLVAPAPPCGFGSVHGPEALPNNPDFSGSGAGLIHPRFVELIAKGERAISDPVCSPRAVMNRMFWKPPFRSAREEAFLTALLQVHLGPRQFPGDVLASDHWPGFAPGHFGPINAISAKYNRHLTREVLDSPIKTPLLMVMGEEDPILSDASASDPGIQGKAGFRPGWPGDDAFPPQPIRTQLLSVLGQYEKRGGPVEKHIITDCGHSPFIENPDQFRTIFHRFLNAQRSLVNR